MTPANNHPAPHLAPHHLLDAEDVTVDHLSRDDLQLFDLRGDLPAGRNYEEGELPF
jgi:hypothetical protein